MSEDEIKEKEEQIQLLRDAIRDYTGRISNLQEEIFALKGLTGLYPGCLGSSHPIISHSFNDGMIYSDSKCQMFGGKVIILDKL